MTLLRGDSGTDATGRDSSPLIRRIHFNPLTLNLLHRTATFTPITKLKRNMKNCLTPLADRLLLRKRSIIESVIDQLKNISPPIAFSASQPRQLLGQAGVWANCLLSSTQEAFSGFGCRFASSCLNRTHVKRHSRSMVGECQLFTQKQNWHKLPAEIGFAD